VDIHEENKRRPDPADLTTYIGLAGNGVKQREVAKTNPNISKQGSKDRRERFSGQIVVAFVIWS
jgi:hypothetical protein